MSQCCVAPAVPEPVNGLMYCFAFLLLCLEITHKITPCPSVLFLHSCSTVLLVVIFLMVTLWIEAQKSSPHSYWSAGLTDKGQGVYRSSTPGGSSESVNGEDGHGQGN